MQTDIIIPTTNVSKAKQEIANVAEALQKLTGINEKTKFLTTSIPFDSMYGDPDKFVQGSDHKVMKTWVAAAMMMGITKWGHGLILEGTKARVPFEAFGLLAQKYLDSLGVPPRGEKYKIRLVNSQGVVMPRKVVRFCSRMFFSKLSHGNLYMCTYYAYLYDNLPVNDNERTQEALRRLVYRPQELKIEEFLYLNLTEDSFAKYEQNDPNQNKKGWARSVLNHVKVYVLIQGKVSMTPFQYLKNSGRFISFLKEDKLQFDLSVKNTPNYASLWWSKGVTNLYSLL